MHCTHPAASSTRNTATLQHTCLSLNSRDPTSCKYCMLVVTDGLGMPIDR